MGASGKEEELVTYCCSLLLNAEQQELCKYVELKSRKLQRKVAANFSFHWVPLQWMAAGIVE